MKYLSKTLKSTSYFFLEDSQSVKFTFEIDNADDSIPNTVAWLSSSIYEVNRD